MSTYTLISSDSHIIEPADLWETRIDRTFRDRAPLLVHAGEFDQWYADGVKFGNIGTNQQAGLRFEAPDKLTAGGSMNTIPLGGVDPHAHVKDMDVDGVAGGVLYPSQGLTVYRVPDSELLSAIFRAYNDRGAKLDARDQHTQPCGRRPVCGCTGTTHQCGVHRPMLFIRGERPEDIAAIHEVHELAFGRPAEADLVDTLRASRKATLSLVAVEDDRIVGHILFSPVSIDAAERTFPAVGLAPMAVLPERQRLGIGSQLVEAGLLKCRTAGYDCVVVLGHPTYYPRFGFVPASRYGLKSEYAVPDEAFMVLAWHEGVLQDRGGVVRYQPEFRGV